MSRLLIPTATAAAMAIVGAVAGASAAGYLRADALQPLSGQPSSTAAAVAPAPAAGCPTVQASTAAAGQPRGAANVADGSGTVVPAAGRTAAAPAVDPDGVPPQLAQRWRDETARWLGDATRDLTIEYTYPEDVESEPAHAPADTSRHSGEA